MLGTLINKELKGILLSPKFAVSFGLCSILILLSVFIGIQEYKSSVTQFQTAQQLTDQQLRETAGWMRLATKAYREPSPMQIFVSGLSYDIGRFSPVNAFSSVRLTGSTYSEDTIFALFRIIDFAFIVQVVLSLFAILFTFDAVCGEREDGTLRLVFASAVPRAKYLVAKCVGAWLGLVIPIAIPILVSMLLLFVYSIPFAGGDWLRLGGLLGASLLYFSFFIVLGVLLSTLTRRPSVSFLFGLVCWVLAVLIIPRAAATVAGQIVQVPTVAEIEGMRDGYSTNRMNSFNEEFSKNWEKWAQEDHAAERERDSADDQNRMWTRMQAHDSARKVVQQEIDQYAARLDEGLRQKKKAQMRLALSLARFSPAADYQLAAMTLAGSDILMKDNYEEAIGAFRTQVMDLRDKKMAEAGPGQGGGIMVSISSESGIQISAPKAKPLDLSGFPEFVRPRISAGQALSSVVVDSGLLLLGLILAFGGAFAAFLRYDVR